MSTHRLDPEFLSYFAFPAGSYWIYNDSITGDIDSTYVIDYATAMVVDGNQFELEFLNYKVIRFQETVFGNARTMPTNRSQFSETQSNQVERHTFHYPFSLATDSVLSSQLKFHAQHDTISVNGVQYANVVVMESLLQQSSKDSRFQFFARNIGIVKRVLFNGEVWELSHYHHN